LPSLCILHAVSIVLQISTFPKTYEKYNTAPVCNQRDVRRSMEHRGTRARLALHAHLFDRFRVLRIVAECIDHRQELGALRVVDLADSQLVQRKKRNAPLPASEALAAQGPIPKAAVH
jgi:hypothetical protein